MLYEMINNNAFVVTRVDNELMVGYYHDVYNSYGETERIFEPLCPLSVINAEELYKYAQKGE